MFEKEAEEKYCKGCKSRIEQCLWAWRNTNGLNEPNEKNCSCIKVPAYIAGAEFGYNKAKEETKNQIAELKTKKIPQLERKIASIRGCHSVDAKKLNARIEQVERLKKENVEVREELTKAKSIIRNLLRVTYGEGWNYSLDVKVKAEQFLGELKC